MMNDICSIDSFVAMRRDADSEPNRGLKPTAKPILPLRGASGEGVPATPETAAKLRQMNVSVRMAPLLPEEGWRRFADGAVGGIVKNKYANNPYKLAAWLSASHVEKAPKKMDPPTP